MKEVYERKDITKCNKLKYTLSKSLAMGATGLAIAFNMLVYNVIQTVNISEKLRATNMTEYEINELYINEADRLNNIQNAAIGLGGASSAYLLYGLIVPFAAYAVKKKSLEKSLAAGSI